MLYLRIPADQTLLYTAEVIATHIEMQFGLMRSDLFPMSAKLNPVNQSAVIFPHYSKTGILI